MDIFDVKQIFRNAKEKGSITSLEALVLLEKRQFNTSELLGLANELNERFNGKTVTYVNGKKIYYTNICRAKCKFCSFYTMKSRKDAFSLTADDIIKTLKRASWVKQLVLEGGLNPELDINFHVKLLKEIRNKFPKLYLQAYTPTEVAFFARRSRGSYREVLNMLKNAGLDSLCGDSAEVLNDKLRKKIRQDKLKVSDWIEIVKHAHNIGLATTMSLVVGHIETGIHISEHLDLIRAVQAETGFVTNLVISPFIPAKTILGKERRIQPEINYERLIYVTAIARLSFGEQIKNITLDWTKVSPERIADLVKAGVNDLGIVEYDSNEISVIKGKGDYLLDLKKTEKTLSSVGKVLYQRNPYIIKKPKFSFMNDSYIVETELVKKAR